MSRRTVVVTDEATREGKAAVLGTANAVAGALDFMSRIAAGDSLSEAFDHAYERAKRRGRALREGDR